MRALIFETIETAIGNLVEHVGLWNDQMRTPLQERPMDLPAVLVEFRDIDWQPLLHGWREGKATVVLHVLIDSRVGHYVDSLKHLTLLDDLNRSLHGLSICGQSGEVVNALTLVHSASNGSFDEVLEHLEEYQAFVTLGV